MERSIIYTPSGPISPGNHGPFRVFRRMVLEVLESRGLIWRLFLRDFSAKYRQSVLGVAWVVLLPLLTVGMFVMMNRSGVVTIGEVGVPYPVYALVGLTLWFLFSTGVTACSNSLILAGAMVVKINFPKTALVFAAAGQGVVEFLVRVALTIIVFAWYGQAATTWGVFTGLLLVLPLCLLMLGTGFVLALLGGIYRDIATILNLALFGLMLLTPVLYPYTPGTSLGTFNMWNPLFHLVDVPRNLVLYGEVHIGAAFIFSSIISLIVFVLGWRLFYLAQPKIAERV